MIPALRSDAAVRILPFALFMSVLVARAQWAPGTPSPDAMPDPRWWYAVQAAVAAWTLLLWRERYPELSREALRPQTVLATLGIGLAVFALWIAPLPAWTQTGEAPTQFVPVSADGALQWHFILARCLGAVVVVPIMEELFWRSFLMRRIDREAFLSLAPGAVSPLAAVLSSGVFALAHTQWLTAFLAGLVYAWWYRRTGSLWLAIGAHATTNAALAIWVVSTRAWAYW